MVAKNSWVGLSTLDSAWILKSPRSYPCVWPRSSDFLAQSLPSQIFLSWLAVGCHFRLMSGAILGQVLYLSSDYWPPLCWPAAAILNFKKTLKTIFNPSKVSAVVECCHDQGYCSKTGSHFYSNQYGNICLCAGMINKHADQLYPSISCGLSYNLHHILLLAYHTVVIMLH